MPEIEGVIPAESGCEVELLKLKLLIFDLKGKQRAKTVQIAPLVTVSLAGLVAILSFHLNDERLGLVLSLFVILAYIVYEEIGTLMSLKTLLMQADILVDAAKECENCEIVYEQAVDMKAETPDDLKRGDAAMVRPASS